MRSRSSRKLRLYRLSAIQTHRLPQRRLSLAFQTQRSVYDCIYLSLAVQLGTQVVTADERFWNCAFKDALVNIDLLD